MVWLSELFSYEVGREKVGGPKVAINFIPSRGIFFAMRFFSFFFFFQLPAYFLGSFIIQHVYLMLARSMERMEHKAEKICGRTSSGLH